MTGELGFGRVFTEHMAVARFRNGAGWTPVEAVPFGDVTLSPAAMVFHYGQAIFEGLKAFRQPDGGVALFRPVENAMRFNASARRLAMPELPVEAFVGACAEVVRRSVDRVPTGPGESLYLRPMMIATEACLGVRPASEYLFAVTASPSGAYFASGAPAITVWVPGDHVRAAPGGTGAAKCAGNYAASLVAKEEARANGCDEVLWLDGRDRRWVEELGGMNVIFVSSSRRGPSIVTPPAGDTILDGVTRKSLLDLARHAGYETAERLVEIGEVGRFQEAFACGTAAVVVPIAAIRSASSTVTIGDGRPGPITLALREHLLAIQEGRSPDLFGWCVRVAEPAVAAQAH